MKLFLITISGILFLSSYAAASPKLEILFIGNSYVASNDLVGMIARIAKSDSKNNIELEVTQFTVGAAKLKTLWDEGQALKVVLKKPHWDFIVLQEQSSWAMYPYDMQRAFEVAPEWRRMIAPRTSNIVLFVSWAKQANSAWYRNPATSFFKDAVFMQRQLDQQSHKLARLLGASMVQVGDYWAYVLSKNPAMPLYSDDGSHPSVTGTYLTALIFYRYFTKQGSLESAGYVPSGVDREHAKILRQLVVAANLD